MDIFFIFSGLLRLSNPLNVKKNIHETPNTDSYKLSELFYTIIYERTQCIREKCDNISYSDA